MGENRKNLKRRLNIAMMIVFVVLQYAVSVNIFLMGDDFMYTVFAKEGCVKSALSYYFTGNGRWILNILDSVILNFGRYGYAIVLPWLMLIFAYLLYKVAVRITKKQSDYGLMAALVLVSIIDVSIARETIYWITGGFNYLIPAIMFLAAVDSIMFLREMETCTIGKKIARFIIIVVSSTTMEQFSLMTIGYMTLLVGYDFYKKKKINKWLICTYCLSLIGLCTIIFAPGNAVRIRDQGKAGQSLWIKLVDLFYMNYFSTQAAKFITVLAIVEGYILFKNKKKIIGIFSFVNGVVLSGSFVLYLIPSSMIEAVASLLILGISTVYVIKLLYTKCSLYYVGFVLLTLLAGSQLMLLTGTVWGFRTSFCTITIYCMLVMLLVVVEDDSMLCDFVLGCTGFYANWVLGIIGLLCLIFVRIKREGLGYRLKTIFACAVMCVCVLPVAHGYYKNRSVQKENIAQTIMAQKQGTSKIEIQEYVDEMYGWTSPPYGEIHEHFFRVCYGIPENVEIVYKSNQ